MRACALAIMPSLETRFVDQLLSSFEAIIKRKIMDPVDVVRTFGTGISRIGLSHVAECGTIDSYQTLLCRIKDISIESGDEELIEQYNNNTLELGTSKEKAKLADSLLSSLESDITSDQLISALSNYDVEPHLTNMSFNRAIHSIVDTALRSSTPEKLDIILNHIYLKHIEKLQTTQSCTKILELFIGFTKKADIKDLTDEQSKIINKIYTGFTAFFEHFQSWDVLLHISNSLLTFGERVRGLNMDFIYFWENSLQIELRLENKIDAKKSYIIMKTERLALGLLTSSQADKALEFIIPTLQTFFSRYRILEMLSRKPISKIKELESIQKLVNILSRVLLENPQLSITFPILAQEAEASILEMIFPVIAKSSNSNKISLSERILQRIKELLPCKEYPVRVSRSGNSFHNITGEMDPDTLAHCDLIFQITKQKNSRSKPNLGRDNGLAYTLPLIKALTVYNMIITNSYSKNEMFTHLEDAVTNFACCLNDEKFEEMDLTTHIFSKLDQFLAFLELQGAHELRVKLVKSMLSKAPEEANISYYHTQLASSYLMLGYTGQCSKELRSAYDTGEKFGNEEITQGSIMVLEADCAICIGNLETAKKHIDSLNGFIQTSSTLYEPIHNGRTSGESLDHFQSRIILFAKATLSFARLNSQEGKPDIGVVNSQKAVKLLQGFLRKYTSNTHYSSQLTSIWPLVSVLIDAFVETAKLYESIGVVREASFYIKEASKLAESSSCSLRLATILSLEGEFNIHMDKLEPAQEILQKCEGLMEDINFKDVNFLQLVHSLALYLQKQCLFSEENVYYDVSEEVFNELIARANSSDGPVNELASSLQNLKVSSRSTRSRAVQKPPTSRESNNDTRGLESVHNNLLRSQVYSLGLQDAVDGAIEILETKSKKYMEDETREGVLFSASRARNSYLKAKKLLMLDPVFGVIQDSALSVPSADLSSLKSTNKKQSVGSYSEAVTWLIDAREHITKNKTKILSACSSIEIAEVSNLLSNVTVLLHAICRAQEVLTSEMNFTLHEKSKGYSSMLNRKTLEHKQGNSVSYEWPKINNQLSENNTLSDSSLNFEDQFLKFIPEDWLVVSMNVCKDTGNLMISRFENGRPPFMLTLPLNRHTSRDADENSFSFNDGMELLNEIISSSNASAHISRTSKIDSKEKRKEWWQERHELDERLKALLHDAEYCWLGGFRGIFDTTVPNENEVEKFKQSFNSILKNQLPSRKKNNSKTKKTASKTNSSTVDIHSRVFELLMGVGHPDTISDPGLLEDLIYFVLDILQFHGEQNAYDEIDIDQFVVEVEESLRGYYSRIKDAKKHNHTVLVLDKSSQNFPWESIPLLRGQPVTRIPSLNILKDLLEQSNQPPSFDISNENFYYMLNPGQDLPKTQERFEDVFENISQWEGKVAEAPTEEEIAGVLETRNGFVYVGHGGGEQYIRSSKIKALEKCCPTLLLGCSSGALEQAGDYDPWGTPVSYMIAGCPMLVANMWDVTDKDIDRFSMSMFKKWGAVENDDEDEDETRYNMAQCVSECREECTLKYLNGSAPVIYGLPLRLV